MWRALSEIAAGALRQTFLGNPILLWNFDHTSIQLALPMHSQQASSDGRALGTNSSSLVPSVSQHNQSMGFISGKRGPAALLPNLYVGPSSPCMLSSHRASHGPQKYPL